MPKATNPTIPSRPEDFREVHDLVGVGCGPANLALAVALEEEAERAGGEGLDRVFLEARSGPCWHPDMLLENALIQISVLKDLITTVNPRSRFTFLNYLHEKDRMFEFLNLRDLYPSRAEFNDYLCWVAEQLADTIRYDRPVRSIRPLERDGGVDLLEVETRAEEGGAPERYLARNVVVATGGRPWTPPGVEAPEGPAADRLFHSSQFMTRIERGFPDRNAPYRFVVVGSGQSGAELFNCLLERYPNADVTATVRGFGYKPADDSDFTNEVFFPEMVDFVYDLPEPRRSAVVDSFRDVNYAVVDHPLIRKIYRTLYDERVLGRDRGRLLPYRELRSARIRGETIQCTFRDLAREREHPLECDGLILCTGYRWDKEHPLLDELAPWLEVDGDGGYRVLRDYRLATRAGCTAGIYLQGYCEATHGIGETVLSLLPLRARDIAESLRDAAAREVTTGEPVAAGVRE